MQSKEQLQAELSELEAKAASIRDQIKSLDKKPTPKQRFIELMLQTNSLKIDQEKYPDRLFGFKDSKQLWEYDSKNKVLRLRYSLIWEILKTEYSLNYLQMQVLSKDVIEEQFKFKGLKTDTNFNLEVAKIEEHFKNKK